MKQIPSIEFKSISKRFGEHVVNDCISFSVAKGSIHAIVGENGAGKSTLMKILFGIHSADSGQILIDGKIAQIQSPIDAREYKIGMVHQHFLQAAQMTALDHVALDQYAHRDAGTWFMPLQRTQILKKLNDLSLQFHMPVNWDQLIERMSVGEQQRIEILKLLYFDSEIIILDEPTAVLTPKEIETFLKQISALRDQGKTILLITHKLKEVMAVADAVSTLRRGKIISTKIISDCTIESLSKEMIGSDHLDHLPSRTMSLKSGSCAKWTRYSAGKLKDLNLTLNYGEILALVGVEGNGQSEVIQSLVRLAFGGENSFQHSGGIAFSATRVAYLPENRIEQAIVEDLSARENFLLGQDGSSQFQKLSWIQSSNLDSIASKALHNFAVEPSNLDLPLSSFSGGNQQKFLVSRELNKKPEVIIAAHPTRGVDIGAIQKIHSELVRQRNEGTSILLVTSELDEALALADRIAVLFNGQLQRVFEQKEFNEEVIGHHMLGAQS